MSDREMSDREMSHREWSLLRNSLHLVSPPPRQTGSQPSKHTRQPGQRPPTSLKLGLYWTFVIGAEGLLDPSVTLCFQALGMMLPGGKGREGG